MSDALLEFFDFLSKPYETIPDAKRQQHAGIAAYIAENWKDLNGPARQSVLDNMHAAREAALPMQRCFIESMLYWATRNAQHLDSLAEMLPKVSGDIALGVSNFHSMAGLHFNASPEERKILEKHLGHDVLMDTFLRTLADVKKLYHRTVGMTGPKFERNGIVVILAKQFLRPPHAPSVRALNFARTLQLEHGKSPIIMVTQEHPGNHDGCVVPCTRANMDKGFLQADSVTWMGTAIPFAMLSDGPISDDSVSRGLDAIASLNPEMIISIGSPSLFAEAFADSRFCFLYQTVTGLPYVKNCYFHTWEEPDETTEAEVTRRGLGDRYLFAQHPGFDPKQAMAKFDRSRFDIPPEAFVFAIVGLRLHKEVDDTFLNLLTDIAKDNPRALFAFIGDFNTYDTVMKKHPDLLPHARNLGLQGDIMAVYDLCDAFLNPIRKGGGGGIVYAMQAGLPALSTPFGDAGLAVANLPEIADYPAMKDTALRLMSDQVFREDYAAKSLAESKKLNSGSKIVARIVEEFNKYADTRV